jgi:hypothetical protein
MAASSVAAIIGKITIRRGALVLLGLVAFASVLAPATPAEAQTTGGDIFNVNPGGPPGTPPSAPPGAPPSSPPGGDQYNNQTTCQETGWTTSPDGLAKWRFLILPAQQAESFQRTVSTPDGAVNVQGCMDWCSATTRLCLVLQADPAKPIPKPRTTGTDCAAVLAAARAAASSIQGGNARPDAIINLTKVLQQCPPAYKRPIDCFDMMVDAQSKIGTAPDFSRRRAQQALDCYAKADGQSPPPTISPPPTQAAACPDSIVGALDPPAPEDRDGAIILAQSSPEFSMPGDWNEWMTGAWGGTVPGLKKIVFNAWRTAIEKREFAGRKSFDPQKGVPDLPSTWKSWKVFWRDCRVDVKVTLRCYAANVRATPITSHCIFLGSPPLNPRTPATTYMVFLYDKVGPALDDSSNIPPWPVLWKDRNSALWRLQVRQDQHGFYVDVGWDFNAVYGPYIKEPKQP